MTDISVEQNTRKSLQLLAAQRQLYTEAKSIRKYSLLGSIGLAVVAPFVLIFLPSSGTALAALGGIWLIIAVILKRFERGKVTHAAKIQEEFDTSLFGLAWNKVLVGAKPTPELITSAAIRFKGNHDELKNWYPDTGDIRYPLNVLLCQRLNLVWDWNLRRQYAVALVFLIIAYVLALIGIAIYRQQLVLEFLLAMIFPALSAVVGGVDTAWDHLSIANRKETDARVALSLWESGLNDPKQVSVKDCREIQDCIFNYRSQSPLVPDWWYALWRKKYEVEMFSTADELIKQAGHTGALGRSRK